MNAIKIGDEVVFRGKRTTVTAVWPDADSNGEPRTAELATGQEVGLSSLKLSDEQVLASRYSTTAARIRQEDMNFLQNEGYFETASKVIECKTFGQWLDLAFQNEPYRITEPFQKSDLGYGL